LRVRARSLGAQVELIYLSASLDVLFERVQRRGMEDPPVTKEDLISSMMSFEVPSEEERNLFDSVEMVGG